MATTRRAAPAAPARRTAGRSAPPARSSGYRGAEGFRKMQEEEAAAEARKEARAQMSHMPFRFFMAPGDSREIVIVDEAPDFFRYEHNMQSDSGRWDIFTACINEHANCPVCSSTNRQPYFAMYLTIIDLTPYDNKDGEEIPWSKKLLVVKAAQQKKIARLYERHGTMRGMILQMTRDSDKDSNIGNDIEFVDFMPEDELAEYVTEFTDKDNKVHEVIGNEVYDYDDLFPEPTEEQLIAISGGRASAGSRGSDRRELGRDNRGGRGGSSRGGRGGNDAEPGAWDRTPRRRPTQDAQDDDQHQDDAPARRAPPARRGAPAPAPEPARRRSAIAPSRRNEPADDGGDGGDDGGYDDQPQAPVRRPSPSPRGGASAPRRVSGGRQQPADDGGDDAPQRGGRAPADASALASRRQALRRG